MTNSVAGLLKNRITVTCINCYLTQITELTFFNVNLEMVKQYSIHSSCIRTDLPDAQITLKLRISFHNSAALNKIIIWKWQPDWTDIGGSKNGPSGLQRIRRIGRRKKKKKKEGNEGRNRGMKNKRNKCNINKNGNEIMIRDIKTRR
jgi:hypothetical protein